ncbi:helix-turn-helix domain-containing protein [Desulfopila sp. IMCC35006]|nr:helix-turn-helix domain-containing protein [Desulfopila sp. IMCC35006]
MPSINKCLNNNLYSCKAMQKRIPIHRELPDLVTVPEAARFLGVGRKVVYQLLEHGVLRAIRQQSKIFIDPCCLYDFQSKGKMA